MATQHDFLKAAQLISHADGLLIAAGAGMGVDSGLPDFRGDEGFWRHYPALRKPGISFHEMASPSHFWSAPRLAWGFYGHRLAMYRQVEPHDGFHILKRIASRLEHGAFVFTSNVDGHFQKAGFDEEQIHECHGSLHYLQCLDSCQSRIWPARSFVPIVDEEACLLLNDHPACPACGTVARPNVLMFNDMGWVSTRSDSQHHKLGTWLQTVSRPVIIELGAGTAVATVRSFATRQQHPLIRINLREAHIKPSPQHVSVPMGALAGLKSIQNALADLAFF